MTIGNTAWLANVYTTEGRYDEATAAARAALEMDSQSAVAWQALGYVYSTTGRDDEARSGRRRPTACGLERCCT